MLRQQVELVQQLKDEKGFTGGYPETPLGENVFCGMACTDT